MVVTDQNRIKLQRSYVTVTEEQGRVTHGGDQSWLSSEVARSYGCGLIAAADILRYLRKDTEAALTKEAYLAEIETVQKDFPVKSSLGITGFGLSRRMNRMFRREGLPFRARWGMSGRKLERRIREMLQTDIPVLLSVGPCFRHKSERLPLYRRKDGKDYERSSGMKDHYVTVTGWEPSDVAGRGVSDTADGSAPDVAGRGAPDTADGSAPDTAGRGAPDTADGSAPDTAGRDVSESSGVGMMEISSWGEKYYVNFNEYREFVRKNDNFLFSNILYIRRKSV